MNLPERTLRSACKAAGVGRFALLALAALPLLGACTRQLMPTPAVHVATETDPFGGVALGHRTNTVDLLYATDREPAGAEKNAEEGASSVRYTSGRSPSLAFGSCVVEFGRDVSWEDLVRNSRQRERDVELPLRVASIAEIGRFPETPHVTPDAPLEERRVEALLLDDLKARLAHARQKEVLLFVHGYHNTFDQAAFTAAEMWHFLGRDGVPIVYSWPAGRGGLLLQGYQYDQESGLFTVHHLKAFLQLLASCPEVEGINILAHSRGTAVVVDALGELFGAERTAGRDPRQTFKIRDLVLAAADIDMMVATQRLSAEALDDGVGRTTAYVSQHDGALGLSSWLFADRRLGRLEYDDLTDFERRILAAAERFSVVDIRAHTTGIGHDYFHSAPMVSSDLVLLLRDDRDPGAENGRPLIHVGPNYWELDDDYVPPPAAPTTAVTE